MSNRKEDFENLLDAIDFYTNDVETRKRDWFMVLTESLLFLRDNYQEVSMLRRCCCVMDEGNMDIRECYQQDLSQEHMKILKQIQDDRR